MKTKISRPHAQVLAAAAFLILVPLVCHFLFSWMGFTPTDEGFTLAQARRILDGQVPHRDFFMIRPFVGALVHAPIVLFGGKYTFWLSRLLVWGQLSLTAWLWVSGVGRTASVRFSATNRVFIALIVLTTDVHTKHLTAWPTIDGLMFTAIGLALITKPTRKAKLAGYCLLGFAPLCKQNFAFIVLAALVILGDWRLLRFWIAAAMPGVFYLAFLVSVHSLVEGLRQLTAATDLLPIVISKYPVVMILLSIAAGYLGARFAQPRSAARSSTAARVAISGLYVLPLLWTAVNLFLGTWAAASFVLFGLTAGVGAFLLWNVRERTDQRRFLLLALATAFCASLSGGYTSPALASGPLLYALIWFVFDRYQKDHGRFLSRSLWIAAILILSAFGWARTHYIYRDRPANELTIPVADVLPGGRFLYTNRNTYDFMQDLNSAVGFVESSGKEYAILTDATAYWVKAKQQNPLPAAWPIELPPPLMDRFIAAMESRRGGTIFIVQKVQTETLAEGFRPLPDTYWYTSLRYARAHFTKIHETKFFELYR